MLTNVTVTLTFPSACLGKERLKRIIARSECTIRGHLSIGLYAMFETVQLPTRIPYLNTTLTNVNRETFTLGRKEIGDNRRIVGARRIFTMTIRYDRRTKSERKMPIRLTWK